MNSYITIHKALLPLSFLYGLGVRFRNKLFDLNIRKSRRFDIPVIGVGNITVGGTGKTPHIEYLIRLLRKDYKVAVLSRGYKRATNGFVMADESTKMVEIGDEPFQMHRKFPDILVAVDEKRCHGVTKIMKTASKSNTPEVILLDDSYQHRQITPRLNILLIDSNRILSEDRLLPTGRLREPAQNSDRADIIIVTKCAADLRPIDYSALEKSIAARPDQKLYFTRLEYGELIPVFDDFSAKKSQNMTLSDLKSTNVLLLTGIASPQQMTDDVRPMCGSCTPKSFGDHHRFTPKDIKDINDTFLSLPVPRIIITTEKDAVRLKDRREFSDEVRQAMYMLPIQIKFINNTENDFNKTITDYVRKDSRNS